MLLIVSSPQLGVLRRGEVERMSSISSTSVVWNGLTFQNRSGVGPSLSSVGSKM